MRSALIILIGLFPSLLLGKESPQPNLIFILCDDLGYGDLGVTWQKERESEIKHITPHLDQFAKEGVLMSRHYCPAPVCAPSRGSLLTGQHQGHCQIRNSQFDKALPDDHTIASALKAIGYRTAIVGKYGLQGKEGETAATWPAYPTKRGFDDFMGAVRHRDGHLHYPAHQWPIGDSENHREKKEVWFNDKEISSSLQKCFTSDLFTAYAKKWITDETQTSPEKPFFLYLAYDTPHAALQLPTTPYPEGGGLNGGMQWLDEDDKMINTAIGKIDSWIHPDYDKPGWSNEDQRQATMIRRIDNHIADLVQLLKDLKIDDNTMIVFSSDNGPHSESYLEGGKYKPTSFQAYGPHSGIKRDTLEGGLRVPTLVRWPGTIPSGKENTTPSQFHDWMATFIAAGGNPVPAQIDGVSLLPTLTGKGEQEEPLVYVEYLHHAKTPDYEDFAEKYRGQRRGEQQVIYLDGYKGLRRQVKGHEKPFQIFDLAKDPLEENDLSQSSPEFISLAARMKDRVLQVRKPNPSAQRPYDGENIPALKDTPKLSPGTSALFLPGKFSWAPRLNNHPKATEIESTSLSPTAPSEGAVEVTAYLTVPGTGEYTFTLETNSSAVLRLHESLVIDADQLNGAGGNYQGTILLEKGLHPIRLNYLSTGSAPDLKWSGPKVEEEVIPAAALQTDQGS